MAKKRKDNLQNPFLEDLKSGIKLRKKIRVVARGDMISTVDRETGEIREGMFNALIKDKESERTSFIKIYPEGRKVFSLLSKNASNVLWFLLDSVGYGDTVALNMRKAKEFTGYKTDKSIYNAISELKEHRIIANHYRNGIYYINPLLFYKGERLRLLKDEN